MTMSTYKSYSSVPVQPANGDRVPVILYASFPPPRKEFNVWKFAFLVVLATFVSYTLLNCIAEDEDQYLREQEEALSQGGAFGRGRSSLLSYRGGVFDVIFGTNGENGANGVEDDSVDVSEHWFTEQVDDHFAADVARKHWEQKYYVNNGSIEGKQIKHAFLYICGEGPCTPSSIGNQLFMHDLATQQNALIVSLEHRFYGESYPTKDMSLESLRLLSSQQAQEDLARFLDYFVHHNELGYDMSETKWIVFGGSYAGAMAAWMKEKYPFLISGSVSSSGPVQAQLNFPEYMDVVTTSMRNLGGDECIAALEDALKTVHDQSQTSQGWEWLGAKFNTCTPIRDEKDLSVFQSSLTGQFSNSVQYNHQINKIPAEDLCSQMTTNTSAIDQLVQIIHISTKGKCVDASWKDSIDVLKEEAFDGQAAARQWQYQTCNEFGYFQSTEGVQADNPFRWLQAMTLDLSGPAVCREVFGIAGPNIDETNRYYGGKDVITANVTYVNAKIDPWHILGVIESTSALDGQEGNEVLLLEGGSHCADMRIIPKYDTDELKNVRERIAANVHKYLH